MSLSMYNIFDFYFKDLADARVQEWPLMSNPLKIMGIIATYLYGVYVFLPSYMTEKKPYSLKKVIVIYNIFQVGACTLLIYGIATSGWTTHYKLVGCQPVDYSDSQMAVQMAAFMWWNMILKLIEFIETVFFVLRKKFNQVSFLHVYHHVSTLIMAWLVCKYFPGGMLSFTVMLNSFIHILMYTYYLLSSFGPKVQKKLETIKPKLTMLQLVQLVILFCQNMQLLSPTCNINNIVGYIFLPNVIINIGFFIKFYINNYSKKNNKEK
ncbi:hypothetical protein FQA39_LY17460 [Lamprigera yunnana]|nr:hypothetical protein FQA39_LY17460 [Lamprigera yunnana]